MGGIFFLPKKLRHVSETFCFNKKSNYQINDSCFINIYAPTVERTVLRKSSCRALPFSLSFKYSSG